MNLFNLKSNELRIGNIVGATLAGNVTAKECGYNDFDCAIFNQYGFVPKVIENGRDIDNANDWYFNIPLTEEWLEKFGFELINEKTYRKQIYYNAGYRNFLHITNKSEDNSCFVFEIVTNSDEYVLLTGKYQFVHSLQNLFFALTNQELELTNE